MFSITCITLTFSMDIWGRGHLRGRGHLGGGGERSSQGGSSQGERSSRGGGERPSQGGHLRGVGELLKIAFQDFGEITQGLYIHGNHLST